MGNTSITFGIDVPGTNISSTNILGIGIRACNFFRRSNISGYPGHISGIGNPRIAHFRFRKIEIKKV